MAVSANTSLGTRRGVTNTGCPAARPSRRDLMTAAGFSALTGIAALAIARPDAEAAEVLPATDAKLIALHDQFMALQARVNAVNADTLAATDDELADLLSDQADLMEEMHPLRATTLAGQRARVRVFLDWHAMSAAKASHSHIDHDDIWPILRDLIGEAA